jgi:Ca-activated chloride channel family protein
MTHPTWPNILRLSVSSLAGFLLMCFSPPAEFTQVTATPTAPINLAIVFDTSASIASPQQSPTVKPKELMKGLSPLFKLNNQNQFFIIKVASEPTVILNGSMEEEAVLKALSKLASVRREGATALYDACYLGLEKITQEEHSKRVLLVVSDGIDTLSKRDLNEVKRALTEKKVKLYAIHVGNPKDEIYNKGARVLDEMASISGGKAFHPKQSEDISSIMESIVAKLQE